METKVVWTRPSPRLWLADHDGRHFRIERHGPARQGGSAVVREVDEKNRTVEDREAMCSSVTEGKRIAHSWLQGVCFECERPGPYHKLDCSQPHKANKRREYADKMKNRELPSWAYNVHV